MYRLVLVMMITAVAWSSVGCGGPGAPVNKAADLRNRSGGGTNEEAPQSSRGNRGAGNQDQNKEDDTASDDEAKSGDSSDEAKESGDGEDKAEEPEKEANKKAASVAESKARLRPGRPAGLGIATGAGAGRGGDNKDEDDLKAREEKEKPPAEVKDDAPVAGIENESPVEKHRFTFFERANYAFSTQNETEAFQYLYAHAIAEDNALNEHPIAWYTGLSEPRLGLRWGVGVDYSAGSFNGDPAKFEPGGGSSAGGGSSNTGDIGGRDISDRLPGGRRRPGNNSGSSAGEPPSGEDPTEQLLYYTGDFGDLLLQRIELRRTNPDFYWGKALHDIDATKTFEVRSPAASGARSAPGRGNRERGQRAGGGSNLSNEDSGSQPPPVNVDSGSGNNNDRRNPSPEIPGFEPEFQADPTSLVPGAIMLGLGNRKEILERARMHGLDLIAVFDVKITGSDNKNTTFLTIINVKTGKEVAETRRLNTVAYANALDGGKENPIELELDKLFPEATDKEYKCSEFPNISADRASKRVEELLAIETDNPLPVLVEVKHYLEKGLITKDEYVTAAEALIGAGNARKLVDGNIDEREEALHDWLPGQYSVNIANSDGFR